MLEGSTLKKQFDKREFLLSLQNNADIIIQLAQDFTIQSFNVEAQAYFNATAQDVIGENFFDCCEKNNWSLPVVDATGDHASIQWRVVEHYNKKNICDGYIIIGKHIDRTTEVFLKNLIAALPGHVYWKDENGVYLGSNDRQAHSLGFEKGEDVIGKTDYDLIWKSSADVLRKNDREVMEQGVIKVIEESGSLNGVEKATFISHKVPLHDENNQVIGILGISLDITDIKRTEAALQEALQAWEKAEENSRLNKLFLENIVANLPGHVYWKDKNGYFLGCNVLQAKSAGFVSASDMIGKSDYEMPWKDQAEDYRKNDLEVMKGVSKVVEEVVTYKDGSQGIVLSNKVPLRDENGDIIGILGISTDISDRKKIEWSLNEEKIQAQQASKIVNAYLENIMANLPGHVYWKDTKGLVLGSNDRNAQSIGLNKGSDMVGKTDYDLFLKEEADILRHNDLEIITSGQSKVFEEPRVTATGLETTFLTHKVPMFDAEGKIMGVLGISLDISDRKKIEKELIEAKQKAEIANQAKSDFIANISHDLRTPLNGILGVTQIMRMKIHYSEQVEFFDDITTAVNTLLRFIEDILDYARIEAGKLELFLEPFDLMHLIEETVNMMSHQASQKNLQLILSFGKSLPRHIIGDSHCLRRILINLVSNAIKFTEQGYVQLEVVCLDCVNDEARLQFIVKDTGIGIPGDKINSIFDRFSRIDPSYRGRYKGTGLGLSIVRQLVDKLNGKITIESELGQGATFYCTLPYKLQDMAVKASKAGVGQEWQEQLVSHVDKIKSYRPKILLVEDDLLSQRYTSAILAEMGCQVDIAENGAMALSLIKNDYDLIFMDIGLPDIDGYILTKEIRRLDYKSHQVPIVALTAHADDEYREQCIKSGMNDFLKKPSTHDDLLTIILRWLIDKHE